MKQSFKLVYSGMMCALSLVVMFLSSLIPTAEYAIPAIAGIFLVAIVVEAGFKSAVLGYVVVSILSALIVPNKQAVIAFIVFLGFYPILKGRFEMFNNKIKEWTAKIITFNICIVFGYYLLVTVVGINNVLNTFDNIYLILLAGLFVANIVFVVYDLALSRVISLYIFSIRKKIIKK